jgi:hypothetical protein
LARYDGVLEDSKTGLDGEAERSNEEDGAQSFVHYVDGYSGLERSLSSKSTE